ncbi:male sterility domain containing protein [Aspergillus tubingensis]|uniref:male sterility domain containing protein n=1 Tax=Aspergillus tubingensis TaxID=5068 RepID=UPI001578C924|nr:male sterility domain containing protein [Aspergillus tubingensis]GFN14356.1 male sterility domain containing protein [Aspergillus tubingensis]
MWKYYNEKSVLVTGGTGFLGTALIHRLITTTSLSCIYLVCRGGIDDLRAKWEANLSAEIANMLLESKKLVVLEGDVTFPSMGLSKSDQEMLRENINIVIHAASPINLGRPIHTVSRGIIGATEMVAEFASSFRALDRFVYVSTAYTNAHIHEKSPGSDLVITEDFYHLNKEGNPLDEWSAVQKYGTSETYEANDFPWAYAYAKHLTERLLALKFAEMGGEEKLLIIRPSIIGPAQRMPFPGYCVPMSSPCSVVAAGLMLIPSWRFQIATQTPTPEINNHHDVVPVDVVVDRLLCHLVIGTQGCVHAVSGVKSRFSFETLWQSIMKCRQIPWDLRPVWIADGWKSHNQHEISRLYTVIGTSFAFSEDKTVRISNELSKTTSDLNLFTEVDMVGHLLAQPQHLRFIMDRFSRKSLLSQVLVWVFYRNYGKPCAHL